MPLPNRGSEKRAVPSGSGVLLIVGLSMLPVLVWLDSSSALSIQPIQTIVTFMAWITWLGYGGFDIGIFVALMVAGLCAGRRELMRRGFVAALTVLGAGLLGQIVKNVVCRARPNAPLAGTFFAEFPCFPAKHALSSFPSGHAAAAFATAIFLSFWYPSGRWLFFTLATLVAISRVVLGAHFPSDSLGGVLIGSASALFVYARIPAARRTTP